MKADELKARIGLSDPPMTHIPSAPPTIPDHEMIRRIGQGSYGEVWLARNAVGTCRAVKVVYRDNFKDARPYEREFSGIQKYEPISRSNEGLVDVLQIGRNDAEGYFYYIMELADDGSLSRLQPEEAPTFPPQMDEPDPDRLTAGLQTYTPRTLSREIHTRGRLPYEECITLGLTLNLALRHLHRHGLIHRDVKPSNIIFVNGVPKLADIGLVTDLADAQSFVGTEGFIPPEGPNSPQADIYALGKVLYEASMGKDRQEFPEPFTSLGLDAESKALMELNAVLLKACAAKAKERYESAEDMNADLALLHSGKSVKHKQTVERNLKLAIRLGLAAGIVALVAMGGYFYQQFETREAKRLAKENRRLAEDSGAVLDFLKQKVLAAARPQGQDGGLGREVTLRRAVEAAEPQIGVIFTNRPFVEARIRDAIGSTFAYLGDYSQAIQQFEQAIHLANPDQAPKDRARREDFKYSLGAAYLDAGRLTEAVRVFEELLPAITARLGPDDPETILVMTSLAKAYAYVGRDSDALPLWEGAFKLSKAKLGPDHRTTIGLMTRLAGPYIHAGRVSEGLALSKEAFRLIKSKQGPEHPDTLFCMAMLANAYREVGRLQEALPLFEESVRLQKAVLGPEHYQTQVAMNDLALAYADADRLSDGISLLEFVVKLSSAKRGPDDWETMQSLGNLGGLYLRAGRLSEALPLLEKVRRFNQAKLGPDHPRTLGAVGDCAFALRCAERFTDAESLYGELLTCRRKTAAKQPLELGHALSSLGECLLLENKNAEAEPLLRESLAIWEKEAPDGYEMFKARSRLGAALLGQKKYLEAEPQLVQGYEGLEDRQNQAIDETLKKAGERLVQLYEAWGKPDQVAEWRTRVEQSLSATKAESLAQSSLALLNAHKAAEAEPLLRECLALREKVLPDDWRTFNTRSSLGGSLLEQKKFDEAESLLLSGYAGIKQREEKIPAAGKPRLTEAAERLVQFYEATDKPELAGKWRQTLTETNTTGSPSHESR